jgi:predicted enzyme related to lactoylglutathione lyase
MGRAARLLRTAPRGIRAAMAKFCRFELRTTDQEAARAFYPKILGHDRAVIWPLHEQALARGAKPHWLGYLAVDDVELAMARFIERGATQLGPAPPIVAGGRAVVLRDPGGAVVALSTPPLENSKPAVEVVWQVLNTNDVARATQNYCELFGWALTSPIDLGPGGTFEQFAWRPGGQTVGALADIATRPGVHPHWLFFFEVDALEPAMMATRAAGGLVLEPITLPNGERVCGCDDPQGAAFALLERQRNR